LARMARAMERIRYRDMLTHNLISGETYSDLIQQADARWGKLETSGVLDITMSAAALVQRVSMFEGMDERTMAAIRRVLKPRLVVPGQEIPTRFGRSRAMYFVASGAVVLDLPDGTTAELGSGQIFGEMALVMDQDFQARARSLGYSRLLMLQERDFKRLLQQYPMLREKIDQIVRQRLRAVELWQQFESGERQHEPLPDLGRTAVEQAPADAAQAPEPASVSAEAGASDPGPHSPSTAAPCWRGPCLRAWETARAGRGPRPRGRAGRRPTAGSWRSARASGPLPSPRRPSM